MAAYVGVGGANRAITGLWVGVGGAWRAVSRADVGVGGAWRLGFTAVALDPTYSISHSANSPANSAAGIELSSDGNIYRTRGAVVDSIGTWTVPGANTAAYEVVATLTGGSVDTGTFGTLNLGTSRGWSAIVSTISSQTADFTLVIRLAGGGATLDSTTVSLSASVSA